MNGKTRQLSDTDKFRMSEFAREITRVCKIYGMKVTASKSKFSNGDTLGHIKWIDQETMKWMDE